VNVLEGWWAECSGSDLFAGTIQGVNFNDTADWYFLFECDGDGDGDVPYLMRYDVVLHYADEDNKRYSQFLSSCIYSREFGRRGGACPLHARAETYLLRELGVGGEP